jgi:hypothetical protein
MTCVVDATDHDATAAFLNHRDRGILNLECEEASAGAAEHPMQRDLDDASVCHGKHITLLVPLEDRIQSGRYARFEKRRALTARHQIPVGFLGPPRPNLWKTLGQLFRAQALPLTEVDLTKTRHRFRMGAERTANRLRRFEGTSEVAGIEAGEPAAGQPLGEPVSLPAAFLRQGGVELALDPVLAVPRRLAVPYEQQAREWGLGRRRTDFAGFRRG